MSLPTFSARIVSGAGRGRTIGSPTMNLDLQDVPSALDEGIYACYANLGNKRLPAALFYGPRPVFKDTPSCEVYVIESVPENIPDALTVEVVGFLRKVETFHSIEDLQKQIMIDVAQARAMLESYATPSSQGTDS